MAHINLPLLSEFQAQNDLLKPYVMVMNPRVFREQDTHKADRSGKYGALILQLLS